MKDADIIVLASGNLGLLYFTKWKNRLSKEQIDTYFPTLILGLVQHDGIGFVMVKSKEFGPVVIGSKGVYRLETGKIEGVNPLKNFGKNAARHLLRESSYSNTPDILINSFYDPKKGEGAAFEELIGFHGGLGGNQARPFIMHPRNLKMPKDKVIGSENLHKVLKNWIKVVR